MPAAYGIDDWCRDSWCEEVKEVVKAVQPDAVMVEYVYMSRVLEGVPVSVLKIIDTHDKFTDRAEVYRAQGKQPAFYYTTESEEAEGLRRADRVVAISPEERDFFERISGVSSFYVPHPIEVKDVTEPTGPGVGFLGSSNDVNRIGLDWFLNQVWPGVVGRVPAARLRIAGTICESIAGVSAPSIELVGRVELDEFYGSVSVIVNPLLGGTGQKIKLIEALGYGKAVVTTSSGASGLEGSLEPTRVTTQRAPMRSALLSIVLTVWIRWTTASGSGSMRFCQKPASPIWRSSWRAFSPKAAQSSSLLWASCPGARMAERPWASRSAHSGSISSSVSA